ncbi:MAG: sugar transferase [Patescibacteria group bacterium]|nr:sugar transferase [Patescibacteria group bacterium]
MTRAVNSKMAAIMVAGDIVAYLFSLILMISVRYALIPGRSLILTHLQSFGILFILFAIVNLAVGLYDKPTISSKPRVPGLILTAQALNVVIGIAYFYLVPSIITPKTSLAFYFIVSTAAMYIWRLAVLPVISSQRKQPAILIGKGGDIDDLRNELDTNSSYGLFFKEVIAPNGSSDDLVSELEKAASGSEPVVVVADFHDKTVESIMPRLYKLIFSGVQVIDASKLYETVFGRIPMSMLGEKWFVENSAEAFGSRTVYDFLKRTMDIVIAGTIGLISLIIYPFVVLAIKAEDGGSVFVTQMRVGKNGRTIRVRKFRSMTSDDNGAYGRDGKTRNVVTKVGRFIRLTRIDELPQLWSVVNGDQSLIGPRPELPALVEVYSKQIPYYDSRHLIKPGLSGWAQIYHRAHPHHAVAIDDTRDKLSYDLFYVKNRSLMLDVSIALQTARAVVSRQGV